MNTSAFSINFPCVGSYINNSECFGYARPSAIFMLRTKVNSLQIAFFEFIMHMCWAKVYDVSCSKSFVGLKCCVNEAI